ncbi:DUF1697 domain-containing protein [Paenibacillus sp. CMAA1364]
MRALTIYVAFLRGINVGGKNIIKMAHLRHMCEEMGLCRVQTYIQSGNILFESSEEEDALREKIEHSIKKVFGLSVSVIVRTAEQMNSIVANCPFTEQQISQAEVTAVGESLYVSLMLEQPSDEVLDGLKGYQNVHQEYQIQGREVYLLFHQSIRNSKLVNYLQKLEVPSTIRNWKTMNELVALAKEMES